MSTYYSVGRVRRVKKLLDDIKTLEKDHVKLKEDIFNEVSVFKRRILQEVYKEDIDLISKMKEEFRLLGGEEITNEKV